MPVSLLIRRILHVINLFVWWSVSLWSTVFFTSIIFSIKFVHFNHRRCLYYEWCSSVWDASQCALFIGRRKRTHMPIACRTSNAHTNQYNFSFNAMRIHMFTHHCSQDGNETLCITITIKNHKTSKEWALSVYSMYEYWVCWMLLGRRTIQGMKAIEIGE